MKPDLVPDEPPRIMHQGKEYRALTLMELQQMRSSERLAAVKIRGDWWIRTFREQRGKGE